MPWAPVHRISHMLAAMMPTCMLTTCVTLSAHSQPVSHKCLSSRPPLPPPALRQRRPLPLRPPHRRRCPPRSRAGRRQRRPRRQQRRGDGVPQAGEEIPPVPGPLQGGRAQGAALMLPRKVCPLRGPVELNPSRHRLRPHPLQQHAHSSGRAGAGWHRLVAGASLPGCHTRTHLLRVQEAEGETDEPAQAPASQARGGSEGLMS